MWHDQIIATRYMDINNKNELQTHQGMTYAKSQLFWQKSIGRTLYSV